MHWLLWLSLTEAEPSNVSRQKHASCTDTSPYKHAGFIAKPERNQQTSRISLPWSLQLQITHQIVRIQYEVLMMCGYRVRLRCRSPAAEPTFAFIPRLAARKGLEPPSASVMALMGARALDRPWDPPHHGCKTSHPLLKREALGSPRLLGSICRTSATARTGNCGTGSWAASCVWGTEAEEPGLRRGMVRQGHGTSSTELIML